MTRFDLRRWRHAAVVESWLHRLDVAVTRPGWRDRAACAGLGSLMYPENAGELPDARAVCERCPVRLSCLAEARTIEKHFGDHLDVYGVRGGLTADQRSDWYLTAGRPLHPVIAAVIAADRFSEMERRAS